MTISSRTGRRLATVAATLTASVVAVGLGTPAQAKTLVVTTTDDGGPGSLRQAVADANAHPGRNTIVLGAAETYGLTCTGGGQLLSSGPLTIRGNFSTIQQECPENRVFEQSSNDKLVMQQVTIRDGNSVRDGAGNGGGILAAGSVKLVDSVLTDNTAEGAGGAIYAGRSITLDRTIVKGNGVDGVGGTVWMNDARGVLRMTDSAVSENETTVGTPYAGLYSQGRTMIERSEINDNNANFGVAGIFSYGDLNMKASTVNGNIASSTSGVVVTEGASAHIVDSTIDDNFAFEGGAGIQLNTGGGETSAGRLVMIRSSVSNSRAWASVGIDTRDATDVYLYESRVVNNVAIPNTGQDGDLAGVGSVAGNITLVKTSITDNEAQDGNQSGVYTGSGDIRVIQSTIATNSAAKDFSGVGTSDGRIVVSNSTISDNLSDGGRAGVVGTRANLRYSTVAGNQGTTASAVMAERLVTFGSVLAPATLGGPLCIVSTTLSRGHNYEQGSDTCDLGRGSDVVNGADAQLSALAENGGVTETRAPAATSPLVDAIPKKARACAGTDQRGVSRPQGAGCDIGAVEL